MIVSVSASPFVSMSTSSATLVPVIVSEPASSANVASGTSPAAGVSLIASTVTLNVCSAVPPSPSLTRSFTSAVPFWSSFGSIVTACAHSVPHAVIETQLASISPVFVLLTNVTTCSSAAVSTSETLNALSPSAPSSVRTMSAGVSANTGRSFTLVTVSVTVPAAVPPCPSDSV